MFDTMAAYPHTGCAAIIVAHHQEDTMLSFMTRHVGTLDANDVGRSIITVHPNDRAGVSLSRNLRRIVGHLEKVMHGKSETTLVIKPLFSDDNFVTHTWTRDQRYADEHTVDVGNENEFDQMTLGQIKELSA